MSDLSELQTVLKNATIAANQAVASSLPLDNQDDFEAATKGLIAQLPDGKILTENGRTVWDNSSFDFLSEQCPNTVNPSLWRMAQLNKISGLFAVADGIWQTRACDYANMTIIQGETGWILVDPVMTRQSSAAALRLVNETLGQRPVSAIIVTHTHPDHFGGLKGVTGDDPAAYPPIYAPADFMKYAASEGVMGGNHMSRRAIYQFGLSLELSAEGVVDGGIGKTHAKGNRTFVKPTHFIGETGTEKLIDGVRFIFQMASGTEAPAEFTFFLPDHNVLCMAEVCTQTMHNLVPPRGAQVRDALLWARTIDEAIALFAEQTDTLINCHNWPVWGKAKAYTYLEEQRDIYKYIHDQTLRLANLGHTPNEIADSIKEPDWLSEKFHARGYYGSLKFNARAVYQKYYGFYDGNPVNLDPLSPEKLGKHVVEAIGGSAAATAVAKTAIEQDELQWAATLLSHILFSDPKATEAQTLLINVFRHMGYREESGIMRNIYLSGAHELELGVQARSMVGGRNIDLAETLDLRDWFDAYAARLNPTRAQAQEMMFNFSVDGQTACVSVARQTEFARINYHCAAPDAAVTIKQPLLESLATGKLTIEQAEAAGAIITGDRNKLNAWLALHDTFNLWFNIVTP